MKIILYTKHGCPWCNEVRDYLNQQNVPFEEKEVLGNKEYFDEMVKKSSQTKAPTLDIDGIIMGDSDIKQVSKFLSTYNK